MNCPRCNAEITENGKFCTFCGASLEEHNTDGGPQPVAPIGNQKYKMAVHVDFGEAIKRLFTNCFAFDGRASRSDSQSIGADSIHWRCIDDRFVLSHDFLRCAPSTRCRLFGNVLPVYSHSFCRRRGLAGVFGSKKRAG